MTWSQAVAKLPPGLTRGANPQVSAGVSGPEAARPAEVRFIDPWGNNVDLSSRGYLGREEKKLPGVRLLAVQVPDLAAACEFYQQQFGLEIAGWSDDGTIRLSDGTLTLMLTKAQVRPKGGVQYFGIQVGDLAGCEETFAGWRCGGIGWRRQDRFSSTIRKAIGWWCRKPGGRIDSDLETPATCLGCYGIARGAEYTDREQSFEKSCDSAD